MSLRSICVYCGSGPGVEPAFRAAALQLGRLMAQQGITLVYGGGSLGLMGAVATGVLEAGGRAVGIVPAFLIDRERVNLAAHEVIVTRDMHERKFLMAEHADAFVMLPGGLGTLEETVEQLTWIQIGRTTKPTLIANLHNYWFHLLALIDHMKEQAFIREGIWIDPLVVSSVEEILPALNESACVRSVSTETAVAAQTPQRAAPERASPACAVYRDQADTPRTSGGCA